MSKTEGFSDNSSCQKFHTSCNSSDINIKGSECMISALNISNSPEESGISRRKKQRKKGKQNVRLSSFDNVLIQPVFSEENNLGNGMSSGDGFISCADFLRVSFSESEALLHTIVHRFSQKNIIVPLENGMDMITCYMIDSGSTGSGNDCCNIANSDAKEGETKLINASLLESASLESKKGNLSDKKSSTGSGVDDVKVKGSVPRGKRSKQRLEADRSSSVRNSRVPRTSYTRNGKENSNSWRRVQKNGVAETKSDLKKSTALLKKEYFVLGEENTASPTKDMKLLKDKAGRKLKGKISPAPKGDLKNDYMRCSYIVNGRSSSNSVNSKNELGSQSRIILVAQRSQASLNSECVTVSGMKYRRKEVYDDISLMNSFSTLKEWDLFEKSPCLNQYSHREKQFSRSDGSNQNRVSDSIAQKWVPIVKPIDSSINNSQPVIPDWTKKTASEEEDYNVSQNSENCPSQYCSNQTFKSTSHSSCRSEGDICYTKHVSSPPTNFCKISRAVNEAYRVQIESEAAEITIGRPIAEFERLVHCSSPVIGHIDFSFPSETCSSKLCGHSTPYVPLGSLWPWYEQHGSYGLEVGAEDFENPKKLGIHSFAFQAYFVPYLSAIQLFKDNANHSMKPRNGCYEVENPLDSFEKTSDLELLFEYFETEQPRQRCPLYEKIQELVRGDVHLSRNMFGDPTNLNSINLHDLHPCSWFSVAWYPIYRIPDGNFRAAFLTFHSFGHLVHGTSRGKKAGQPGCHAIFPVVGLQSYNAEGECWLQPRQPALSHGWDTVRLLKERLRTLETVASLMARAVVNKGNQMFRNTHPDYEFFLSRRH